MISERVRLADVTRHPATPPHATTGAISASVPGRCVDAPESATANGTQMAIWDCRGAANQVFTRSGTTLQLLGKCLETPTNATAGTRTQDQVVGNRCKNRERVTIPSKESRFAEMPSPGETPVARRWLSSRPSRSALDVGA